MPWQFIEGFDDGDLAEYSGDLGTHSVVSQSGTPFGTTNVLRYDGSSGYDRIYSESGLAEYPEPGNRYRYYFMANSTDVQHRVLFGVPAGSSGADGYELTYEANQDDFVLIMRGATDNVLDFNNTATGGYVTGEWWYMILDWRTNGDIICELYNEAGTLLTTISATDTTYGAGGLSWYSYSGAPEMFYAGVEKENLSETADAIPASVSGSDLAATGSSSATGLPTIGSVLGSTLTGTSTTSTAVSGTPGSVLASSVTGTSTSAASTTPPTISSTAAAISATGTTSTALSGAVTASLASDLSPTAVSKVTASGTPVPATASVFTASGASSSATSPGNTVSVPATPVSPSVTGKITVDAVLGSVAATAASVTGKVVLNSSLGLVSGTSLSVDTVAVKSVSSEVASATGLPVYDSTGTESSVTPQTSPVAVGSVTLTPSASSEATASISPEGAAGSPLLPTPFASQSTAAVLSDSSAQTTQPTTRGTASSQGAVEDASAAPLSPATTATAAETANPSSVGAADLAPSVGLVVNPRVASAAANSFTASTDTFNAEQGTPIIASVTATATTNTGNAAVSLDGITASVSGSSITATVSTATTTSGTIVGTVGNPIGGTVTTGANTTAQVEMGVGTSISGDVATGTQVDGVVAGATGSSLASDISSRTSIDGSISTSTASAVLVTSTSRATASPTPLSITLVRKEPVVTYAVSVDPTVSTCVSNPLVPQLGIGTTPSPHVASVPSLSGSTTAAVTVVPSTVSSAATELLADSMGTQYVDGSLVTVSGSVLSPGTVRGVYATPALATAVAGQLGPDVVRSRYVDSRPKRVVAADLVSGGQTIAQTNGLMGSVTASGLTATTDPLYLHELGRGRSSVSGQNDTDTSIEPSVSVSWTDKNQVDGEDGQNRADGSSGKNETV